MHGFDGYFSFGTLKTRAQAAGAPPVDVTAADLTLADVMQRYWVNFVKTGNPNGAGLPTWPVFREPDGAYVELTGDGATVKRALRRAQCDLYIENAHRVAASSGGR
jgi:para-nitrobenzyl esterase